MVTTLIPIQIGQLPSDGTGGQPGRREAETPFAALIGLGAEPPPAAEAASEAERREPPAAAWAFPWPIPTSSPVALQPLAAAAAAGQGGETIAATQGPQMPRMLAEAAAPGPDPMAVPLPQAGIPEEVLPAVAEIRSAAGAVLSTPASPVSGGGPSVLPPAMAAGWTVAAGEGAVDRAAPVPPPSGGRESKPGPAAPGRVEPAVLLRPSVAMPRRLAAAAEEGAMPTWPAEPAASGPRPSAADPAATARPAQTPEARPAPPAVQIALSVARAGHGAPARLVVELTPRELGRVEIMLDSERRGGRARITADRRETLDLLVTEARVLEKALADAGIDLGRRGIEFALRGDGGRDREPPSPQAPAGPMEEPAAGPRPETASSTPAPGIALTPRGLDILV
ncbi:flagellar hook-length control protein FliK [Inquilinus sp. NPDC058860]|uniref:flagellar hook-length control protein FliK n=1 Tax=Inquilinus sp. NPDC058860 TaxID=3346652 RepID=UPI00367AD50D